MKNVTIVVDEDVARWARVRAAEEETSLSRFVGELLRRQMLQEQSYEGAMRAYLSQAPRVLRKGRQPYPRRRDLHER